jgi:hypothetical protein
VAGLAFVGDLGRLVTASRDGCVFVWRLPASVVGAMRTAASAACSSSPPTGVASLSESAARRTVPVVQAPASVAAVPSRRPTILDLERQQQPTADPPIPQLEVDVHPAGESGEGTKRRAAFLASLLDESHRTALKLEDGAVSSAKADPQLTPSTQSERQPQPSTASGAKGCKSDEGQHSWAARRGQPSAVGGVPLDDLCVEELDEVASGKGAASACKAKVESGLGELEDDEDEEEDATLEDSQGSRNGSRRGAAMLAASQEAQDFQVFVGCLLCF